MLQGETAAAESYDEGGMVHLDTMERYRSEGFKLTCKRKLAPENETINNDQVTIDDQDDLDDEGQEAADVRKIRAVRLSFDRFEYVADYEVDKDMPHDLSPFDPDLDDGTGKRGLRVIRDDTRTRVTNTLSPSNRIVGQLDYFNRINSGRCSGTVILSDAVLTAGHCVHTRGPSGRWMDVTSFAPARYRTNLGNIISPYGNFRVSSITTFQRWSLYGVRTYDVAVVKLSPRNSRNIGSYVGYAGLRSTTWNDRVLASCSVRGYPDDKLNGEMWTSGLCGGGFFRWMNAFGLGHYCDTSGGMSGSAHMTVSGYISAVHVVGTDSYNISVLLNGAILQGVIRMARR
jgi:V8-like Glu-specific endopeptidase